MWQDYSKLKSWPDDPAWPDPFDTDPYDLEF